MHFLTPRFSGAYAFGQPLCSRSFLLPFPSPLLLKTAGLPPAPLPADKSHHTRQPPSSRPTKFRGSSNSHRHPTHPKNRQWEKRRPFHSWLPCPGRQFFFLVSTPLSTQLPILAFRTFWFFYTSCLCLSSGANRLTSFTADTIGFPTCCGSCSVLNSWLRTGPRPPSTPPPRYVSGNSPPRARSLPARRKQCHQAAFGFECVSTDVGRRVVVGLPGWQNLDRAPACAMRARPVALDQPHPKAYSVLGDQSPDRFETQNPPPSSAVRLSRTTSTLASS